MSERGGGERGEGCEGWVDEVGAWCEAGFVGDGRAAVPRADLLADVAAKDVAADSGVEIVGDGSLVLDGEVGDAARGVHTARVGRVEQGLCRAGVDAGGAGAAAVGMQLEGWLRGEWERGGDGGEEEPGAELLVDEAGVAADPAETGAGGEVALEEWASVDVAAGLAGSDDLEVGLDGAETAQKVVVVIDGIAFGVAIPGVAGDPASGFWRGVDGARTSGVVVEGTHDDRFRPWNGVLDSGAEELALLVAALEVVHFGGVSGGDPVGEAGFCWVGIGIGWSDAGEVEAFGEGSGAEPG